jgi:hypothetical protein
MDIYKILEFIGLTQQKIRVYSIEIFFYFILIVFIWSFRGIILYPILSVFIKIYNFFATEALPNQSFPNTNVNLPPKSYKN